MQSINIWINIAGAVIVALSANAVATIWAQQPNRLATWWLLAVLLISPLVFITFGLVAERAGMAVAASTIDALLTVSTICVGLLLFGEWHTATSEKLLGLTAIIIGIALIHSSH